MPLRIAKSGASIATFRIIDIDNDAFTFLTAAGITNTTQRNAINKLVIDLKYYNLWTKQKALYPFVGGVAASHAVNLKTPGTYNLTFTAGWVHSSTGALPNGTSDYANTGLVPSSVLQTNSAHISFYSRTDNNTGFDIGINSNSASGRLYMYIKLASIFGGRNNNTTSGEKTISNTNGLGYYINNRIDSSNIKLVKNGNTTTLALTSRGLDTSQISIGGIYNTAILGYSYGTKQCAFASIGDGLTDQDALNFYRIVQQYQTNLGRQV